jgi:arginine decarboxylase
MAKRAAIGTSNQRSDHLFSSPSARADRWRRITASCDGWQSGHGAQSDVMQALEDASSIEEFFAYPGGRVMAALRDRISAGDAAGSAAAARRISGQLLDKSFRSVVEAVDQTEDAGAGADLTFAPHHANSRPYFEVLFVSAAAPARWAALAAEVRRLRRSEDNFVYEPVFVGSFEDAVCAAALNPAILSVVAYQGFGLQSRHNVPVLRSIIDPALEDASADRTAFGLCRMLKKMRPELDLYLLSDQDVEKLAGDPEANAVRRMFYAVEEPLELHLAILEGIQDRFQSPFFDNLKNYAKRPIGTFHALPIARGKSIFKSDWIRDMGEFYGINLFLAESSATTGGLDSLLEPTGTIKKAQALAARAFGGDHAFFVTNGTSTSNKMVHQALCAPGDIVILDRNCHKSHHYGCVLAGAQPLYVEAFPLTEFSMYGAVPLATIKSAMLALKAEGRLDRLKMVDLTNCTFDGHMYNTRRVMEECLAIKPDVVFLWDEAWSAFARWSPYLRPRTAMGAAAEIEAYLASPEALKAYEAQQAKLGPKPSDDVLMQTHLLPDPRAVRLRVYQTSSIHKSMSAIRQGSMVIVKDVDFGTIEAQFHEAIFTHASTSPNQQLIASLDVARRQMELEGYGLVMNAIEIALAIRRTIAEHPLISKYFSVAGADQMIPAKFRQSGFKDFLTPDITWADALKAVREDEFILDPTRMTLICGAAGFDGTQFKGILAERFNIQINKTSRNSVLLQSNINNTRSDVAHLIRVLVEICSDVEKKLAQGGDAGRKAFAKRVTSLMTDVPDLPNFSSFHPAFRKDAGAKTVEGDMRSAFYCAYKADECEYVPIFGKECDDRLKNGPPMVSSNFVIPYPPGFPILVPGQVVTTPTIEFMRKLDVKEIHGYEREKGLKLITPSALAKRTGK